MLKHGKYVYVELNKDKYLKVRVLKSRDENSPERYILTGFVSKKRPIKAQVIKLENLPTEIRDKITKTFL
ncbi:DUF5622 domain-containing protein [Saccharolobus caldissimus]|uniref:DUF5622 domain-containing protein n=1 Tax=Saccharolobus caldissimus TaxID=1702097 RepID=A0AAQ4CPT5_9CREN|nr:DUF5622 domain-containing protein [Saccharolobus caldissimus]BDB97816.1 hypothetical protein SACC_08330 [Saccharolobus caldissimus]